MYTPGSTFINAARQELQEEQDDKMEFEMTDGDEREEEKQAGVV